MLLSLLEYNIEIPFCLINAGFQMRQACYLGGDSLLISQKLFIASARLCHIMSAILLHAKFSWNFLELMDSTFRPIWVPSSCIYMLMIWSKQTNATMIVLSKSCYLLPFCTGFKIFHLIHKSGCITILVHFWTTGLMHSVTMSMVHVLISCWKHTEKVMLKESNMLSNLAASSLTWITWYSNLAIFTCK